MTQLHATRPQVEPDEQMQHLRDIMLAVVPFWVAELRLRNLTPENLASIASRAGKEFSHLGDQILFVGRLSGQKLSPGAQALNALAEGIAAAELIEPGTATRIFNQIGGPADGCGVIGNKSGVNYRTPQALIDVQHATDAPDAGIDLFAEEAS